jgi:hypothetical protein
MAQNMSGGNMTGGNMTGECFETFGLGIEHFSSNEAGEKGGDIYIGNDCPPNVALKMSKEESRRRPR